MEQGATRRTCLGHSHAVSPSLVIQTVQVAVILDEVGVRASVLLKVLRLLFFELLTLWREKLTSDSRESTHILLLS